MISFILSGYKDMRDFSVGIYIFFFTLIVLILMHCDNCKDEMYVEQSETGKN